MNKYFLLLIMTSISLYAENFTVSTTAELRVALNKSAINGTSDTIILADGLYKTTDDAMGTFRYVSDEKESLKLLGSNSLNVIISGDNKDAILDYQSTEITKLTVENLSFIDANNSNGNGGAIFANVGIEVFDCTFKHNNALNGAGFYTASSIVEESTFINNSAFNKGGGFYSASSTVKNSDFVENQAYSGAGFYASFDSSLSIVTVLNSVFTLNKATYGAGFYSSSIAFIADSTFSYNTAFSSGGGLYSVFSVTVKDSTFMENNASKNNGGGFYSSSSSSVINSIFSQNKASRDGGAFYSSFTYLMSSLLFDNSSGIYLDTTEESFILNNIFKNMKLDIEGITKAKAILKNNYIDISTIKLEISANNNIYSDINLGFVNTINQDYNLTSDSDLIDAGTTDLENIIIKEKDLNKHARVVGGSIDIGPYEFSVSRPTISGFGYSGIAKTLKKLSFSVHSKFKDGRELSNILYNYSNNDDWTENNTHVFKKPGNYIIKVKVTDNTREFSIQSLTLHIKPLLFSDMSDKEKFIQSVDPLHYEEILKLITVKEQRAEASGIKKGEKNVLISPAKYNLVSKSTISLTSTYINKLARGWTLTSTALDVTDLSIFDNVSIIWVYNSASSTWGAYSSNAVKRQQILDDSSIQFMSTIPAGSGIWIKK